MGLESMPRGIDGSLTTCEDRGDRLLLHGVQLELVCQTMHDMMRAGGFVRRRAPTFIPSAKPVPPRYGPPRTSSTRSLIAGGPLGKTIAFPTSSAGARTFAHSIVRL